MLSFAFCTALFLWLPLFSASPHLDQRIVNGNPTTFEQYDFVVNIEAFNQSICTGTLLDLQLPSVILTSAYCVTPNETLSIPAAFLRVGIAQTSTDASPLFYAPVMSWTVHPDFNSTSGANSVAILFLNVHLEALLWQNIGISTVTIADTPFTSPGGFPSCCNSLDALQALGYGTAWLDGPPTNTIEYADKVYIERVECSQRVHDYLDWQCKCTQGCPDYDASLSDAFCEDYVVPGGAAFNQDFMHHDHRDLLGPKYVCAIGDKTNTCVGDTGGPLIKAGTREQVGIIIPLGDCHENLPGLYVNLPYFKQWIQEEVQQVKSLYPSRPPTPAPVSPPTRAPVSQPTRAPVAETTQRGQTIFNNEATTTTPGDPEQSPIIPLNSSQAGQRGSANAFNAFLLCFTVALTLYISV